MEYLYYNKRGIVKMVSDKKLKVSVLSELKKKLTDKQKEDLKKSKKVKYKDNKLIIE